MTNNFRVKKVETPESSSEEEVSEYYEYVMEDLPQETAVFGPSRPIDVEALLDQKPPGMAGEEEANKESDEYDY